MEIDKFIELCKKHFRRENYRVGGSEWHVRALCYCRHKVMNEEYDVIAGKPAVIIGNLVHAGVEKVLNYKPKTFSKEVGKYVVYGTPDFYDGRVIEVKFTRYPPLIPRPHDILQLRLYLWLLDEKVGYLWYLSPEKFREFEIAGSLDDFDVLDLIENPRIPMWPDWECKYCSLKDCPNRRCEDATNVRWL